MKDQAAPDTEFTDIVLKNIESGSGRRALTFDAARYEAMIEAMDLSEDAKHELLGVMWNIIVSFVDLGVEVKTEAAGIASQSCGQSGTEPDAAGEAVLDCPIKLAISESFSAAMSASDEESKQKEKA